MTGIAESVINFFTPAYQSFCLFIWERDLTQVWAEQTGLPWTRIHEHVIFWLSLTLLVSLVLNSFLTIKLRGKGK